MTMAHIAKSRVNKNTSQRQIDFMDWKLRNAEIFDVNI